MTDSGRSNVPKDGNENQRALEKKTARGAGILVGMRFVVRLIGLASMLILARLLAPSDYGIIALATFLHTFLIEASDFNPGLALIRNQNASRSDYNTAWTIGILRGLILAATLLVISAPFSAFYEEPRLNSVLQLYALMAFMTGLENIGTVNFMKQMRYWDDFKFFVIPKIVGFVIGVTAAIILRNYWALVIGSLSVTFTRLALSYILDGYRPWFSTEKFRSIFAFSKWIWLDSGISYLALRVDILVFGKFVSSTVLGFYTFAMEFATVVTSEIALPVARAVYPALSKIQTEPEALRAMFGRGLFLVVLITVPLGIGLGAASESAVAFLLGSKWAGVAPLLSVVSIFCVVQVVFILVNPPFFAMNRPDIPMKLNSVYLLLKGSVLLITIRYLPITEVLLCLVAVSLVQLVIVATVFHHFELLRLKNFVEGVWRPVMGAIVMAASVKSVQGYSEWLGVGSLLVEIIVGATAYMVTVMALWRISPEREKAAEQLLWEFFFARYMTLRARFAARWNDAMS